MCFIGAWGHDPKELVKCAAVASVYGMYRVCTGLPGTYQLAFGKGKHVHRDVYGVLENDSEELCVRAKIPLIILEPTNITHCPML